MPDPKCGSCKGFASGHSSCKCSGFTLPVRPLEVLLEVGDGPEGIKIYTSEEEGVVDWANSFPALYIEVSVQGAYVKLGPFQCFETYRQLMEKLGLPVQVQ